MSSQEQLRRLLRAGEADIPWPRGPIVRVPVTYLRREIDLEGESTDDDDYGYEQEEDNRDKKENESLVSNCPVCMDTWTSEGPHRVCCIPCGHVYGRSCLEKWLNMCGNIIGKCPQCNKKFKPTDIINLYALKIPVPNDDLQKGSGTESTDALKSQIANLISLLQNQQEMFKIQEEKQIKQDEQLAQIKFRSGYDLENKVPTLKETLNSIHLEIKEEITALKLEISALKLEVKAIFDDIMICFKTFFDEIKQSSISTIAIFNQFSRLLFYQTPRSDRTR